MKLLYFSPDELEVAQISKEFLDAGIPCEVRNGTARTTHYRNGDHPDSELWIRNDKDAHRALMLCVQLGVGFAKRPPRTSLIECWSDLSSRVDNDEDQHRPAEKKVVAARPGHPHTNGNGRHHSHVARSHRR